MEDSIAQYIRPGIFVSLLVGFGLLEYLLPRRELKPLKFKRWFTNMAIIIIDSVVVRLLFKSAAIGVAIWAIANGYGLFNILEVPYWLAFVISFLVLDFSIWLTHLASHKFPILWRIHRMHHSDVDIDVSTAIRFHPIEIVLSMIWKFMIVIILGAPVMAVLVFEIVLNGGALFNHSNMKLPLWFDKILRLIIVTPDMHRVHHSIIGKEHNSNYGFNLSIWDRMFSTYIAQPSEGHDGMTIGLPDWQDEKPARLDWTLMVPFKKM
ncbi:MAG: sterol desaturase family protein [Rhizobiaceae bacterium]|nr:sterol desaturase family protein [Rhizobiaceae bacterium]